MTVRYIYGELQRLKERLLESSRRWPLAEIIRAYSNLLIRHWAYMREYGVEKNAVEEMCRLWRGKGAACSARWLGRMCWLWRWGVLAPDVQRRCGLGDLAEEAAARAEKLIEVLKGGLKSTRCLTGGLRSGAPAVA